MVYKCNGILPSHYKSEVMPFVTTWVDLEIIILSKVSQRKTDITCYHLYAEF